MSIFGTLLGLISSGVGLGVADAKSKRKVREMQDDFNRHFADGCDPKTEYKLTCEIYEQVLEFKEQLVAQIKQDLAEKTYSQLAYKYPDIIKEQDKFLMSMGYPPLRESKEQRELFFDPQYGTFKTYAYQEGLKQEFLQDWEIKSFDISGVPTWMYDKTAFDKAIAITVASRKMRDRGFTPISSASCITSGGYYGYKPSRFPRVEYISKICCNPTERQVQEAIKCTGYLAANRRDGAAGSSDGLSDKERKEQQNKKEENRFFWIMMAIGFVSWILIMILKYS